MLIGLESALLRLPLHHDRIGGKHLLFRLIRLLRLVRLSGCFLLRSCGRELFEWFVCHIVQLTNVC